MTTREKVELLLQQVVDLPDEAQTEFVQSLLEMRAQDLGIYRLDDDVSAATAVGSAIKLAVAQLQAFPRLGTITDEAGIFLKIARPYRYLIFYSATGDTIIVRNVRHPARQYPPVDRS